MERKSTDYAVDYLSSVLENCLEKFEADTKVKQATEAHIVSMFQRYMAGAGAEHVVLSANGDYMYMFDGKGFTYIDKNNLEYLVTLVLQRLEINNIYTVNSAKKIADKCALFIRNDQALRFKPDRRWAVFDNCVFDLMEFKMVPHSPDYRSDLRFDYDYDPNAYSELWEQKLAETIPDRSMRDTFQEFCGSMLDCRGYKIEYACFLIGPVGQNGKSLIVNAIKGVFNQILVSSITLSNLFKAHNKEYYAAEADGKIMNVVDDLDYKDFSGGEFKAFVSSESITAREPCGKPFETWHLPKLICNVNDMPPISDDSGGLERRMMPISCPNIITDEMRDESLPGKLAKVEVKQAIFNWLVEGYMRIVERGGKITLSVTMQDMRAGIMENTNSARRWLAEYGYEPYKGSDQDHWRSFNDLMREYTAYCKDFNYNPQGASSVGRLLSKKGFEKRHMRSCQMYNIGVASQEQKYDAGTYPETPGYVGLQENEDLPF